VGTHGGSKNTGHRIKRVAKVTMGSWKRDTRGGNSKIIREKEEAQARTSNAKKRQRNRPRRRKRRSKNEGKERSGVQARHAN